MIETFKCLGNKYILFEYFNFYVYYIYLYITEVFYILDVATVYYIVIDLR